jgi:hypothetical protein
MLEVECAPKGFQIQEPASTNGFAIGHLGVPRYATDADTPAAEDVEVMKQLANDNSGMLLQAVGGHVHQKGSRARSLRQPMFL